MMLALQSTNQSNLSIRKHSIQGSVFKFDFYVGLCHLELEKIGFKIISYLSSILSQAQENITVIQ
jgi:hypothetical protein